MENFWKSVRGWLPGLLISIIALAIVLYVADLQRFLDAIRRANYTLLLGFLISSVVWLVVRGIVWRILLRNRPSYRNVFFTICEGYLLNNFLPFRLGEVGRAFLLSRKARLDFMEVLSTIVIERTVDLAFSAAFLLGAVPFVVGAAGAGHIAMIIGGCVVLGLVILFILACNRNWTLGVFHRISLRWPRLQRLEKSVLEPLFSGLGILTDGGLFLRFLVWMTIDWAIAVGQFFLLLLAFFPNAEPLWAIFGLGAVAFGNALPSLPGALGTYEGALAGAISLFSHDESTALALAVTAHLCGYLVTGIIGLYALSREGETLLGVYRQIRRKQAG